MLTVATIAVPQVLVTAPTWTLFIAPGFMFAALISMGYRLSNIMDEEVACLLTFIPGIAAVLIIAPGVFEKKGIRWDRRIEHDPGRNRCKPSSFTPPIRPA